MTAPETTPPPSPWSLAAAEKIFERLAPPGAGEDRIAPILAALQQEFGYVDARGVTRLAQRLGVERSAIYAVMTRARGLRRQPPSAGALKICRAEACRQRGVELLVAHLEQNHGFRLDAEAGKSPRLETAYCLGACGRGPNLAIGGVVHDHLDRDKLDALIAGLRKI